MIVDGTDGATTDTPPGPNRFSAKLTITSNTITCTPPVDTGLSAGSTGLVLLPTAIGTHMGISGLVQCTFIESLNSWSAPGLVLAYKWDTSSANAQSCVTRTSFGWVVSAGHNLGSGYCYPEF